MTAAKYLGDFECPGTIGLGILQVVNATRLTQYFPLLTKQFHEVVIVRLV
jgi:hypothetical protein